MSGMTIEKAKAVLPNGYEIEIVRCGNSTGNWWRAIVSNDAGQPWAIGEDAYMFAAIDKAVAAFKEHKG